MILYPAIDLLDGRVVRLHKGDFGQVTDYGDDPAGVARRFLKEGASWIHVVDLSGARDGARRQSDLIAAIAATGARVQTGGGVRSIADIEALRQAGASRVVVGSKAVTDSAEVKTWLERFGGEAIALALDVKPDQDVYRPAVKGWTETVSTTLDALIGDYADAGLKHALVTDISRDGALEGPNVELYRRLAETYPSVAWQASGGVASLEDLTAVRQAGAAGAIAGKAIYSGRFTVEEALQCLQSA